jgi:hypothetical protein
MDTKLRDFLPGPFDEDTQLPGDMPSPSEVRASQVVAYGARIRELADGWLRQIQAQIPCNAYIGKVQLDVDELGKDNEAAIRLLTDAGWAINAQLNLKRTTLELVFRAKDSSTD